VYRQIDILPSKTESSPPEEAFQIGDDCLQQAFRKAGTGSEKAKLNKTAKWQMNCEV